MQVIKPSIEIIDMDDYEKIVKKIERIGRVCYKSEGKITEDSAEKFIKGLLTRQHESVIEHENVTVRFVCDRGVTHEIVRHTTVTYEVTVRKAHVTATTAVTNLTIRSP